MPGSPAPCAPVNSGLSQRRAAISRHTTTRLFFHGSVIRGLRLVNLARIYVRFDFVILLQAAHCVSLAITPREGDSRAQHAKVACTTAHTSLHPTESLLSCCRNGCVSSHRLQGNFLSSRVSRRGRWLRVTTQVKGQLSLRRWATDLAHCYAKVEDSAVQQFFQAN